jgi:hypothetical protein
MQSIPYRQFRYVHRADRTEDADNAIARLSSPVTSLMDMGAASKMIPASAPLVGSGCLDLHDNVA